MQFFISCLMLSLFIPVDSGEVMPAHTSSIRPLNFILGAVSLAKGLTTLKQVTNKPGKPFSNIDFYVGVCAVSAAAFCFYKAFSPQRKSALNNFEVTSLAQGTPTAIQTAVKSGSLSLPKGSSLSFLVFASSEVTVQYTDTYTGQQRDLTVANWVPQNVLANRTEQANSIPGYEITRFVLLRNFGLTRKEWLRSFFRQPYYYAPMVQIDEEGSKVSIGMPHFALTQPDTYREGVKVPTAVEYQQTATDTTVRVDCGRFVICVSLGKQSKLSATRATLYALLSSQSPKYGKYISLSFPIPSFSEP